jgi:hypothetical protein
MKPRIPGMNNVIESMLVVIPACNEEILIGDCLRNAQLAMEGFTQSCTQRSATLTVVLDRCFDASKKLVERFCGDDPRFHVVEIDLGNVGAARAIGIEESLRRLQHAHGLSKTLEQTWIACTDADTRVPAHWLESFAHLAHAGADAVLGTVEPDRRELGFAGFNRWQQKYQGVEGHEHIHGANLGVRASAYRAVGGFAPMRAHEDVDLIGRLRASGAKVLSTDRIHAVTSGRISGRLTGGFADYLAALQQQSILPENSAHK